MLIKALSNRPELIVLDEPFDGLDVESTHALKSILTQLSKTMTMLFVLNQLDDIPDFITHFGYVVDGQLHHQLAEPTEHQRNDLFKLLHLQHTDLTIPNKGSVHNVIPFSGEILVKLHQAKVSYNAKAVFSNLNWTIKAKQHWQLSGKNGSGKTCLLNLITGDNPQCYSNNIEVFG